MTLEKEILNKPFKKSFTKTDKLKFVCQKCGKDVIGYVDCDGFTATKTKCECYVYGVKRVML